MDLACLAGLCAAVAEELVEESPVEPPGPAAMIWVGVFLIALAQIVSYWILARYHRRVVNYMNTSSAADNAGAARAPAEPITVEHLVAGMRSRSRAVFWILCLTAGVFAVGEGWLFATRVAEGSRAVNALSTAVTIVLFAALAGPIVLLGVSAARFGRNFWTYFAPVCWAAITIEAVMVREAGQNLDDSFAYLLKFLGVVVAVTGIAVIVRDRVPAAVWRRIGDSVRAHPWISIALGLVAAIALLILADSMRGTVGDLARDFIVGGVLALLLITLLYFSVGDRNKRVVTPLLAIVGLAFVSALVQFGNPLYNVLDNTFKELVTSNRAELAHAAALLLISLALAVAASYVALSWIGYAYERKQFSDAQFQVYAWMLSIAGIVVFVQAALCSMPLSDDYSFFVGAVAALALAVYSILIRLVKPMRTEKRLLLLRVFAQDRRGELLLDEVAHRWRFVGPIMMIGGPDLARSTIDPAEAANFLRGKFSTNFVPDQRRLDKAVAAMDERPDPDGRYRINEFFCYDDVWKDAVERLVRLSDAILLDVRGFTAGRQGTAHEIGLLARVGAIRRTVLLVDEKTDMSAVRGKMGAKADVMLAADAIIRTEEDIKGDNLFQALAERAVQPAQLLEPRGSPIPASAA